MKKELQCKDLRIGNLVYNREGNKVWVNPNHLIVMVYGINDLFKPIPLTEEMCDNLGCYYGIGGEPRFLANDLSISIHFKNECVIIELGDGIIFIDYIEYVHELQNLYFALTGEELTQVSEGENKNFV